MASRKNAWVALAGIAAGIAFLMLSFGNLDMESIVRVFSKTRLFPWILFAIFSYLTGHVVRGFRTCTLVSRDAKLGIFAGTNVVVLGYAVNNILFARLGELARAGMLSKLTKLPVVQSLTVTFLERILDGWVLFLFLGIATLFVPIQGWIQDVARLASIVFLVATMGILFVLFAPNSFISTCKTLTKPLPHKWHEIAIRFASSVARGLEYIRHPFSAVKVLALSVLVWTLEAGHFMLLLPVFGINVNPWLVLLTMSVTNLGILIPSAPGHIGPFHFFFPYPGTELHRVCKEQGLLKENLDLSTERHVAVLDLPGFGRSEIQQAYIWFDYLAFKGKRPLTKVLSRVAVTRLKTNSNFNYLYRLVSGQPLVKQIKKKLK